MSSLHTAIPTDAPTKPVKRQRTDAHEPSSIVPHPTLHFDDGNTLLISSSDPPMAFKVHRSILALNCTVFSDMFALPQPMDAETIDGCPVVRLSETSDDLGYFFSTMFDQE